MDTNDAFIITLAYPETIVSHADEWYSKYLQYIGIGNKTHVRAGHAALVLISKQTGVLEYFDFGRYITPEPMGRVRGKTTDAELHIPIVAHIENDNIINIDAILGYLATHPEYTHGEGTLYASLCHAISYKKAKAHIAKMQELGFIRYAAFLKHATNCARFVTNALIASSANSTITKNLRRSKWFTPSPVRNVILANTEPYIYSK